MTTNESKSLRAGTQTGSLINHVLSGADTPAPCVGLGCTILHRTDRNAATVIECIGDDVLVVQRDIAVRVGKREMSDAQSYTYERNEDGAKYAFRKDRKGAWRLASKNEKGRWVFDSSGGNQLLLGSRQEYFDYSY